MSTSRNKQPTDKRDPGLAIEHFRQNHFREPPRAIMNGRNLRPVGFSKQQANNRDRLASEYFQPPRAIMNSVIMSSSPNEERVNDKDRYFKIPRNQMKAWTPKYPRINKPLEDVVVRVVGQDGKSVRSVDSRCNLTDLEVKLRCPLCPYGTFGNTSCDAKSTDERRRWFWNHFRKHHPGQQYFEGFFRENINTTIFDKIVDNPDKYGRIARRYRLLVPGASVSVPRKSERNTNEHFQAWCAEDRIASGVVELLKKTALPIETEVKITLQMLFVFWNTKCGTFNQLQGRQYTKGTLQKLIDKQNALLAENPSHKWSI